MVGWQTHYPVVSKVLPTGIVFPKATLDSPIKDVNWMWSSLEYPTVIGILNRTFCVPVCISNTSGLLPGNLSTMSIIARKRLKSLLGSFDSIKDRVKNSDSLGIEGEVACAECPLFEKPLLSLVKSYSRAISQYIDIVSDVNYLGKKALVKISKEGIKRKLMGVKIDLDKIEMMEERLLHKGTSLVGQLRSAVYSPHFKKVVGIAMIKKQYWDKKTPFELEINGKKSKGLICDLPLV